MDRNLLTSEEGTLYMCVICGKGHSSLYDLEKHEICHKNDLENTAEDELLLKNNEVSTDSGKENEFEFVIAGGVNSKKKSSVLKEKFPCDTCGGLYATKTSLKKHKLTHTVREATNFCEICNKSFTEKRHLVYHYRTHNEEKHFKCEFCGKGFHFSFNLKKHIRTHTGEKPYVCGICKRGFSHKNSLNRHVLLHTQSCKCTVCDQSFCDKVSLDKHFAVSHGTEGYENNGNYYKMIEQKLKQEDSSCNKIFQRLEKKLETVGMEGVSIIHSDLDSDYLDTSLEGFKADDKISKNLKKEVEDTRNEFICGICMKSFNKRRGLSMHVNRQYKDVKEVNCKLCNTYLLGTSEIKLHLMSHTYSPPKIVSEMSSNECSEVQKGTHKHLDASLNDSEASVKYGKQNIYSDGTKVSYHERKAADNKHDHNVGKKNEECLSTCEQIESTDKHFIEVEPWFGKENDIHNFDNIKSKLKTGNSSIDKSVTLKVNAMKKEEQNPIDTYFNSETHWNKNTISYFDENNIKVEKHKNRSGQDNGEEKNTFASSESSHELKKLGQLRSVGLIDKTLNECNMDTADGPYFQEKGPIMEKEEPNLNHHSVFQNLTGSNSLTNTLGEFSELGQLLRKEGHNFSEVKNDFKHYSSDKSKKTHSKADQTQSSISSVILKLFKCPICERGFRVKSYLHSHMKVHTGEKPHKCPLCDRGFAHKFNLTKHMRTHTGEKPYKCTFCGRQFSQKNSLNRHVMLHTGLAPYTCHICGKNLCEKAALEDHLLRHRKYESEDKPFHDAVQIQNYRRGNRNDYSNSSFGNLETSIGVQNLRERGNVKFSKGKVVGKNIDVTQNTELIKMKEKYGRGKLNSEFSRVKSLEDVCQTLKNEHNIGIDQMCNDDRIALLKDYATLNSKSYPITYANPSNLDQSYPYMLPVKSVDSSSKSFNLNSGHQEFSYNSQSNTGNVNLHITNLNELQDLSVSKTGTPSHGGMYKENCQTFSPSHAFHYPLKSLYNYYKDIGNADTCQNEPLDFSMNKTVPVSDDSLNQSNICVKKECKKYKSLKNNTTKTWARKGKTSYFVDTCSDLLEIAKGSSIKKQSSVRRRLTARRKYTVRDPQHPLCSEKIPGFLFKEKPYKRDGIHKCTNCLKSFSSKISLKYHNFDHAKERNHVCGICKKAFRFLISLRIHLSHHKTT